MKEISTEYRKLHQGMIEARDAGILNEYDISNIIDFTNRLTEHLFKENLEARQEVNAVMGGEVLETYADQMIAKGRKEGIAEGLLEGERRGLLEGQCKGKVEILYEMNFPIEKIAERLHISTEQVKDILHHSE